MEFSSKTEPFVNFFIDHFQKFYKKKSEKSQKELDKIYKKIYSNIKKADESVSKLSITKEYVEIFVKDQIPQTQLLKSNFVPEKIKDYITENSRYYILYKTFIKDPVQGIKRDIELFFVITEDEDLLNFKQFDSYAEKMFLIISLLSKYAKRDCNKSLTLFLYLTPFKKELPELIFTPLGPENANSGLTTLCNTINEICIYRKEEFFKLFIHECFHAFSLDFSSFSQKEINQKIKSLFPIYSEYNIYEAYTEFWANILNCAVISYFCLKPPKKKVSEEKEKHIEEKLFETFTLYLDFCIQMERMFSLFQMVKILSTFTLKYNDLYENNEESKKLRETMYREETSIFSYYILKTILLYYYVSFLKWCNENNSILYRFSEHKQQHKYSKKIQELYSFIEKHYKKEGLLKDIEKIVCVLNSYKTYTTENLKKTTRMTLFEIKI